MLEYVPSEKVHVEFRMDSVQSQIESDRLGHPAFVEKPFITISVPGSQLCVIDTAVDETHKNRFPVQWARFQAGASSADMTGWQLESWPAVNTAQVKTLKHLGVYTVEQLAGLSDQSCQNVGMGTMELRVKAKAALAAASSNADTERMAAEGARRDAEMADLKQLLREQASQIAALTPKKPGRPPKVEEEIQG